MATGHIRTRTTQKGTVYQAIIEISATDPVTGKRTRKYKTFKKKGDAQRYLNETIHQLNHGTFADSHNMSVETLMSAWLKSKEFDTKQTTLVRYREQTEWYITSKLGKYPINYLNPAVIQDWVNELHKNSPTKKNGGKPLSAKTVRNIFLNLKAALDYAVDNDLISRNPCNKVNLPRQTKQEVEAFNNEEIKNVLDCAQDTDLYFPIYLMLHTGMRRGELLGLRWCDVHIDSSDTYYIEIKQTRLSSAGKEFFDTPKSANSCRKIFLSEQAQKEFADYRLWCRKILLKYGSTLKDDALVIMRSDGKYDTPDNFTKRWNNFLKKNNIRHLKLHGLRHTCATMLLQQGVDVKTISKRLGHADAMLVCTTYGHSSDESEKSAAKSMDAVLSTG